MVRSILTVFVSAGLLCVPSCDQGVFMFNATFSTINDGTAVRASWTTSSSCTRVEVDADGDITDAGLDSYCDVTTPAKTIKATAYWEKPGVKPTTQTKSYAAVTTEAVTLYSMSDSLNPEHAQHGLRFYTVDGSAHAVAYDDPTRSSVTFVLVDSGDSLFLLSASDFTYPSGGYWTMWSGKAILAADDFANLKTCPPATANWSNRVRLVAGQTYALDATDNSSPCFVKVKVEAINGKAVTLKAAVQKTWRLRWVVTE